MKRIVRKKKMAKMKRRMRKKVTQMKRRLRKKKISMKRRVRKMHSLTKIIRRNLLLQH